LTGDERKRLEKQRDEARGNAELFRAGAYKLEELVTTRNKERDEARAEVRQLRAELHAARIAEPDSEAYREATRNWQDMTTNCDQARAELRTALLSYHLLARANQSCGRSLDRRCWACGEMGWPGGDR